MNEEQEEKQQNKIKRYYKKIDKRLDDIKKSQEELVAKWADNNIFNIEDWK